MKTVLIPVDFSESSINSCKYAFDFLGKDEALVHLFHIYNDQVLIPDSSFAGSGIEADTFFNTDIIQALKQQAESEMEAFKLELKKVIEKRKLNIELKHTILGGDPRWEITETIEELQPDIVIMGTEGKGGKGFLQGSMAEKIMNKSTVPVLAVPKDFNLFSIKNVLYTTSFNPMDVEALKLLFKILANHKIVVHVCHFMREKEKEDAIQMIKKLRNELKKEEKAGKINFNLVQTDNEKEALGNFSKEHQTNLISFLPGKKHLLKDLFSVQKLRKKDLFSLELPLLAVHI